MTLGNIVVYAVKR